MHRVMIGKDRIDRVQAPARGLFAENWLFIDHRHVLHWLGLDVLRV
jgi:hypothetical protein